MARIHMQVGYNLNWCMCDDTRNTVLLSLLPRRRRQSKKRESCEDSLLGSESESCVGGEERGELVVWLVKFKGICKNQTAGSPKSPGPASIQAKNRGV